jgi:hypothetical protein
MASEAPIKPVEFTVDGEPVTASHHKLTADQILHLAGDDPAQRYLVLVEGRDQTSYKDRGGEEIHLRHGMTFVTASLGPTPTS